MASHLHFLINRSDAILSTRHSFMISAISGVMVELILILLYRGFLFCIKDSDLFFQVPRNSLLNGTNAEKHTSESILRSEYNQPPGTLVTSFSKPGTQLRWFSFIVYMLSVGASFVCTASGGGIGINGCMCY